MRTEYAQEADLRSRGAMVSPELLVRCLDAGARFRERPVRHHPRMAGRPSGADPQVILRALRELLRLHRALRGGVRR